MPWRRIPDDIRRVLVFRLGSLGDTVVALPSFPLVARAFPRAERRVLTSFNVTRVMKTGEVSLFSVGTYDDRFSEVDGELLIRERNVLLDSRNLDTLLVIPI